MTRRYRRSPAREAPNNAALATQIATARGRRDVLPR
jgi:hypothetical protein